MFVLCQALGMLITNVAIGLEPGVLPGHVQRVNLDGEAHGNAAILVETLSTDPPVFSADDFIDDASCEALIGAAREAGLQAMPRHFDLFEDQAFLLRKPMPGSLWDLWPTVDTDSDGAVDVDELRAYVQRRLHIHAFSSEDAYALLVADHEHNMPYMSRRAFASYDWDTFLAKRHNQDPAHFIRFGEEAFVRSTYGHTSASRVPGGRVLGMEPAVMGELRTKIAKLLGWPEDLILPSHGEPLRVIRYNIGGHTFCHFDSDDASVANLGRKPVPAIGVQVFLSDGADDHGGALLFPAVGPDVNLSLEQHELERRCHEWCNGSSGVQFWTQHAGLRVMPKRGRIVLWHNHVISAGLSVSAGDRRSASLNADCPVKAGEKWIASFSISLRAAGLKEPTTQERSAVPENLHKSSLPIGTVDASQTEDDGSTRIEIGVANSSQEKMASASEVGAEQETKHPRQMDEI